MKMAQPPFEDCATVRFADLLGGGLVDSQSRRPCRLASERAMTGRGVAIPSCSDSGLAAFNPRDGRVITVKRRAGEMERAIACLAAWLTLFRPFLG